MQRPPVAGDERVAVAVAPALHQLLAGAPHTIDQLVSAGEYPAIAGFIVAALDQPRVLHCCAFLAKLKVRDEHEPDLPS